MNQVSNCRQINESFPAYRQRLRHVAAVVKHYLRGFPATQSRDERKYVVGPHRTHQPHPVKLMVPLKNGKVHTFEVTHPGTLVKAPKAA